MRLLLPALTLLGACASGVPRSPAPAPTPATVSELRTRLESRIRAQAGAEVAVWFHDLERGDSLAIGADVSFHAASTMKLPVMIELFRRVDAGRLSLDQTLRLENRFTSIVDGSPFTLDPGSDSDSAAYTRIGAPVTLRELNERMITRSSNLATNAIIQLLDARQVNATARALGATSINVLRGVEDSKAFAQNLNNTTTAHDLGVLLAGLERHSVASAASCDAMRAVLLRQEFNDQIPAGLPPGTKVAHKTGSITATWHDAAIVYPARRGPYVLVVLTRKIPKEADGARLIADLSREVYGWATR
jgi:beta-lactamase class A